jgi:hypothetical protein
MTTPEKKPYERPVLTKVELRPEEAVLGNCKTGSAAGPGNMPCDLAGNCFNAGS